MHYLAHADTVRQDFTCDKASLVAHMKYFAAYFTDETINAFVLEWAG